MSKTLFWDIETSPLIAPVWGLWQQDIYYDSVIMPWHIICAAYSWGDGEIVELKTGPGLQANKDYKVVKELHKAISQADILVAHNGDKFDLRKFNTRAVLHGFDPIPPVKTVDTLKVARKYFKFDSNRLDSLGQVLGLGGKMDNPKGLWLRAIAAEIIANPHLKKKEKQKVWEDQEEAINMMSDYCGRDVELLEDLYLKLRPYIQNHPNANVIRKKKKEDVCPNCESTDIRPRGFHYTRTGAKQRYRCHDCGAWSSDKTAVKKANIR